MSPVRTPLSPRVAWLYLTASMAVVVAICLAGFLGLLPAEVVGLLSPVITATVACAMVVGIRRNRPDMVRPWVLMVSAIGLLVAGWITGFFAVAASATEGTLQIVSNAIFMLANVPMIIAVLLLTRLRRADRDLRGLIDASVVTLSLVLLTWVYVHGPAIRQTSSSASDLFMAVGFPLIGAFALWVTLRFAVSGRISPSVLLLVLAPLLTVMTDTVAAYAALHLAEPFEHPVWNLFNLVWMCAQAAWGAALLHPSMRLLSRPQAIAAKEDSSAPWRILVLAAASLLAPLILIVQSLRGDNKDVLVIAGVSCALFVLVASRMAGLLASERRVKQDLLESYRRLQDADIQLRNAQKLKAIGKLSGGVAHEINTPLQVMSSNVQFIRASFETMRDAAANSSSADADDIAYLSEEVPQSIADLVTGLERVTAIVEALKRFGDHTTDDVQVVDVNELLADVITMLEPDIRAAGRIVAEYTDVPLITCERGNVSQMFLHVMMNGIEAVKNRHGHSGAGELRIGTCLNAAGSAVVIAFTDTGTGIPVEVQDRIFEPFFTTKDVGDGSGGQGLALAHATVMAHGGTVRVESEVGSGTTVELELPLQMSMAARKVSGERRFGASSEPQASPERTMPAVASLHE